MNGVIQLKSSLKLSLQPSALKADHSFLLNGFPKVSAAIGSSLANSDWRFYIMSLRVGKCAR